MNVFITGGAGYIGLEVSQLLLKRSDVNKVGVFDNFSRNTFYPFVNLQKEFPNKLVVHNGDILDGTKLANLLQDYEVIIHLAAITGTILDDRNPHLFEQINHWGTASLANEIEALSHITNVVYLSSASVYGVGDNNYSVGSGTFAQCTYGGTKYRGEMQLSRLRSSCNVSILRSGTVFGFNAATRFDSFINKFMFSTLIRRPIKIDGTGEQIRPITSLVSVALELVKCALEEAGSSVRDFVEYNLSVMDIVNTIRSLNKGLEYSHVNREISFRSLSVRPLYMLSKEEQLAELRLILSKELGF